MKRLILIITIITAALLSGCGYKAEIEKLQNENDSLRNLTQDDQMTINEYLAAFNEIQENLNEIKRKENIISMNSSGDAVSQSQTDQIIEDMQTIYQLMQENKKKLDELKQKLAASNYKNQQLKKTIQLYEEQLRAKDEEISQLKTKLEALNIQVGELQTQVEELSTTVDTLSQITEHQQEVIQQQDIALNTAYYVVGNKQELKEHNILNRDGFLSKLTFDTDADLSYFTKIDIREVKEIPLGNAKKIQVLSKHPSDSYELVKNDNGQYVKLKITNYENFWKFTKFLVVLLK